MDSKINNPAFPQPITKDVLGNTISAFEHHPDFSGMTLRDYFAAAALQGMLAFSSDDIHSDISKWTWPPLAEYAYKAADAMLAERSKESPTVSKSTLP